MVREPVILQRNPLPYPDMTGLPDREDEKLKVNARLAALEAKVAILSDQLRIARVELADLHFGRKVSREQADQTDPEWFA